ncbi:MAG: ArsR/SmtB family transcription factor [Solirubrobacteraceae bacterium]
MINARFDAEALTSVRFAISPMVEMIGSLKALEDPARGALHVRWIEQARGQTQDLDLSCLRALHSLDRYSPDFIHPPPTGPLAEFEDELSMMLATPGEQIRAEVLSAYQGEPLPAVLEPFIGDPSGAVRHLADLMRTYWERSLSEHWTRIRSLLEHDVLYRARQIADGGTRRLFADLDPAVAWKDGVLRIDKCDDTTLDLDERGLLLLPSVFAWPSVMIVTAPPWQPTLIYPARGVGMLWQERPPAPPDALVKLVGRNRAALLLALDCPRSTIELAGSLGVSNGGISQQLSILKDAGLVKRRRVQRYVLYLRSLEGDALVAAANSSETSRR